jgi:hypothetical protein
MLAVGVALLAGAAVAGEARAADGSLATSLPGIKLPPIEVELAPVEVKVPSIEVDLAPVEVKVPSVEVKLPPVDVKLPSVEAKLPPVDVNVPKVDAPGSPRSPGPPASTAPVAPSGAGAAPTSTPARGHGATARETSRAVAPGPATSGDAAAAGGAARGGAGARRDATSTTPAPRGDRAVPPAIRRRERRLRQLVRSLSGCLGALPSIETRVLTLRAGDAARPPLSRRQVARRLDLGLRRVTAVERRGLDRLREQARAGGCPGAPAPAVAAVAAGTGTAAATPASTTPAASQPPRSESGDRSGVVDAVKRSLGGVTAPQLAPSVLLIQAASPPLLVLLVVGFLAGFAVVWVRESRAWRVGPAHD